MVATGIVPTFAQLAWDEFGQPERGPYVPYRALIAFFGLCLLAAVFLAWRDEHQGKTESESRLAELANTRPRPMIRPRYLSNTLSIDHATSLLWFDNVGNEAAFNIEFDDLLIGKAVVFIGRIDSLVKDGGSDKPLLRGTLGEKPYGLSPPTSEQVLEIALYSEYTKLIAGLVNTESELAPIDDSGTVFKLGNTEHYEWPLTVHYEDSTGLCYTSQYSVRLSIPLAEIAFLHKAPLARSRSKARL